MQSTTLYHWIANYGGDLNNAPTANTCNAANESVVVIAAPFTTSSSIPTLSECAMGLLATLLAIAGFVAMRKGNK